MYKKLIGLYLSLMCAVALASLLAATNGPIATNFALALPIVLAVGFLVFILARWRK